MLTRRRMLELGGVVGGATLLGVLKEAAGRSAELPRAQRAHVPGHRHMGAQASPSARAAQLPPAFSVPMTVPPVLTPTVIGGTDVYRLPMRPADVEIVPGLRSPALTYGGAFVGPTIRARTGRRTVVAFGNRLDEAANVHLHGGHVPQSSDGYPMDLIAPGRQRLYDYPNRQRAATLWYHDHTHHMEDVHVYQGLHGFYLLEDPDERRLGLPG